MELKLHDTISLWTPAGNYEIQMMYGDITQLSMEDKVDIVMVSAFPGDYGNQRGTVIGSLKRILDISTQELAKDKEFDLRQQFFCWLSKPIKGDNPYKRLLCFERNRRGNGNLISQIRDMFRVFAPVFYNRETTVITPLLATGNQGQSKSMVLSIMLECAASWIEAGLPMKCLKIVVYGDSPDTELNEVFAKAKKKYSASNSKLEKQHKSMKKWDIFITAEVEDMSWAKKIENTLKSKKKELKVYVNTNKLDESKVWQDDLYKLMSASERIIVVLTPSFIGNPDCLEQFNMAMCCSRMRKFDVLLPFYIFTANNMPAYMNLVQYRDCRIRKENDVIEVKITEACLLLLDNLQEPSAGTSMDKDQGTKFDYDVFISYSHKNPGEAETILKMFSDKNPDLKIFFDREELTMGSMWQKSLYHSLDSVKCVLALMSPPYVSSLVCQEEYNLALYRHLSNPKKMLFIPMRIDDLDVVSEGFGELKMLDARGDNFKLMAASVVDIVTDWLRTGEQTSFNKISSEVSLHDNVFEKFRSHKILETYWIDRHSIRRKRESNLADKTVKPSVALCFAGDSLYCPVMIGEIMSEKMQDIDIRWIWNRNENSLHDLDTAQQIIVFLSDDYIESDHTLQDLHMALCRQRSAKGKKILHIVQIADLTYAQTFLHLLHYGASFKDKVWIQLEKNLDKKTAPERKVIVSRRAEFRGTVDCRFADYFAMIKVADDIIDALNDKTCTDEAVPNLVNVIQLQKSVGSKSPKKIEVEVLELHDNEEQSSELSVNLQTAQKQHTRILFTEVHSSKQNQKSSSSCSIL